MTPKWGFRVAMLLVGALCWRIMGRTVLPKWPLWAHLFYSGFYNVSELRSWETANVVGKPYRVIWGGENVP